MSVLIEQMVKGVLITPNSIKPDHIKMLKERGMSVTLIDAPRKSSTECSVSVNEMRALLAAGIRIPDDVSLLGYDDIEFAPSAAVPLSTIAQPAYQMGFTATQLLLSEREGVEPHAHQDMRFQPELVVRSSIRDLAKVHAQPVFQRVYTNLATSHCAPSVPA